MKTFLLALIALCCAAGGQLRAAEATPVDPDIPQPVSPDDLTALITSSPFTRTLNLSGSLVLTGIAHYNGGEVVTLMNKDTKETYVVTKEPNSLGWRLAETNQNSQLNRTQAKIMIGSEVITVRYNDDQLTPESMKKGGFKPGGGTTEQNATGGGDRRDGGRYEGRSGDGPRREGPRPSEEDMNRMKNLSDKGKEVLRNAYMESREKMMNATPEQRAAFFRENLQRAEAADRGGSGGSSNNRR
ncbi:hypothetical protein AYO49_00040 [Verrucomicrobiaceae bacterium SCGC AG-212-N21]|nr:hypothetical protein AYO49_00040 [Verrucomicrobiaceae bacterium SCGC AG-212-N21]